MDQDNANDVAAQLAATLPGAVPQDQPTTAPVGVAIAVGATPETELGVGGGAGADEDVRRLEDVVAELDAARAGETPDEQLGGTEPDGDPGRGLAASGLDASV